jgi:hypothetical protein
MPITRLRETLRIVTEAAIDVLDIGDPHSRRALEEATRLARLELSGASDPWLPLASAPRDGSMLWLLVDYSGGEHALVDNQYGATIGFNEHDKTGVDRWQFAGWCWTHDHFTEGRGKPLAWKAIGFDLEPPACFRPLPETAEALQ